MPTLRTLDCHLQPRNQQAWFRWREVYMPRPIGAYVRGRSANPACSTVPRPTVPCLVYLNRFLILASAVPDSRGAKPNRFALEPATPQIGIFQMYSERKYLLLHDGLSRAKAQVQLCFLGSDPREYGLLAKKAGTVGHVRRPGQ